jgi:hypothetical protein
LFRNSLDCIFKGLFSKPENFRPRGERDRPGTQRNAAMVEETVAAIHALNDDVSDVESRVAKFEVEQQSYRQPVKRYA